MMKKKDTNECMEYDSEWDEEWDEKFRDYSDKEYREKHDPTDILYDYNNNVKTVRYEHEYFFYNLVNKRDDILGYVWRADYQTSDIIFEKQDISHAVTLCFYEDMMYKLDELHNAKSMSDKLKVLKYMNEVCFHLILNFENVYPSL